MRLPDLLVAVFFGSSDPPPTLEMALTYQGVELTAPGYSRVIVPRGAWAVDGNVARAELVFGPFVRGVRIDGARLHAGGDIVDAGPLSEDGVSEARLLPGMTFTYIAEYQVG